MKSNVDKGNSLYHDVRTILHSAQQKVHSTVNSAMVEAYWLIGRRIVEEKQQGKQRAEYGKKQLEKLARQLTTEFGKGFHVRNLRNMRAFYQTFPIRNVLRTELSWTNYRCLVRIEDSTARQWYLEEAIAQNWSARY